MEVALASRPPVSVQASRRSSHAGSTSSAHVGAWMRRSSRLSPQATQSFVSSTAARSASPNSLTRGTAPARACRASGRLSQRYACSRHARTPAAAVIQRLRSRYPPKASQASKPSVDATPARAHPRCSEWRCRTSRSSRARWRRSSVVALGPPRASSRRLPPARASGVDASAAMFRTTGCSGFSRMACWMAPAALCFWPQKGWSRTNISHSQLSRWSGPARTKVCASRRASGK
mmetsp:Transcript_33018/g.102969  ORF Transcript_33018/g.102969 Transcript_33018/m.102969 type:complete len:233 (-) Transcript_33018:482-1180(-)